MHRRATPESQSIALPNAPGAEEGTAGPSNIACADAALPSASQAADGSGSTSDAPSILTAAEGSGCDSRADAATLPSTRRTVNATPAAPLSTRRKGKKQPPPRLYTPVKVNKLELNLAYIDASDFCVEQAHKRAVESKKKKKRRQAAAKAKEAAGMGHLEPEVEPDPEMERTNRDTMAIIQKANSSAATSGPATVRSAQWLEEQRALTAQFSSMYASNS